MHETLKRKVQKSVRMVRDCSTHTPVRMKAAHRLIKVPWRVTLLENTMMPSRSGRPRSAVHIFMKMKTTSSAWFA
jgi:hypothetical protein